MRETSGWVSRAFLAVSARRSARMGARGLAATVLCAQPISIVNAKTAEAMACEVAFAKLWMNEGTALLPQAGPCQLRCRSLERQSCPLLVRSARSGISWKGTASDPSICGHIL